MADLISRAWVLAEYDRQHQGQPGGARKIMEEAPAVDAIPVEWLVNLKNEYACEGREQAEGDLMNLLLMWQKEQGVRT